MKAWIDSLCRATALGGIALAAVLALSPHAGARVVVGIGVGVPLFMPPPVVVAPPPYYYYPPPPVYPPPPPTYYYPPPAGYSSPPASYSPPPAGSAPPPPVAAAPPAPASTAGQQCRQYQSTSMINGTPQQTTGTACLQADGTWRIVN